MLPDAAPNQASDIKTIARELLQLANADYQKHVFLRGYYARISRQHGLTHQEIADEYGVTEAAVRAIIKRAAK
jgi:DNA-directed RNA polymerase specialized sigma24 family protein